MFVDRVSIFVKGGDGGAGCCSFRREKYVPKGGPDGGDGGDGGDVIVRAVAGTDSLAEIVNRKHWRADAGGRGRPDNCHGRKRRRTGHPRAAGHAGLRPRSRQSCCAI